MFIGHFNGILRIYWKKWKLLKIEELVKEDAQNVMDLKLSQSGNLFFTLQNKRELKMITNALSQIKSKQKIIKIFEGVHISKNQLKMEIHSTKICV